MTDYRRGDVILVQVPYTDQRTIEQRPTVVISSDEYNKVEPDLIVLPITGRIERTLGLGDHLLREWRKAGLLMPSLVKAKPLTVEKSIVARRLGGISAADMRKIEEGLRRALSL